MLAHNVVGQVGDDTARTFGPARPQRAGHGERRDQVAEPSDEDLEAGHEQDDDVVAIGSAAAVDGRAGRDVQFGQEGRAYEQAASALLDAELRGERRTRVPGGPERDASGS